jgi:K+-transporting ATPase KdpF subunit
MRDRLPFSVEGAVVMLVLYIVGGVVALLLLVYLFFAMLAPEALQ